MAQKKIGALIALDGEKEFRQSVTDCNKSLMALKSEMSLVKAESEGQANSLEALQKKHGVLSRVLEEQEKKQEAVATGLDHAREEYEKVGSGIESLNRKQEAHVKKIGELKGAYGDAEKRLGAMEKAGESSEQAMKKQEAVVQSLAAELKQEETALSDVSSEIARGEKNYQSAGNHIKDWETKLNTAKSQTIKASSELNKNAAYMKEAEDATDHCATSIDEFGKTTQKATEFTQSYTEIIRNNLINTAVDAAKSMASAAMSTVTEFEDAANQLQASTGASAREMEKYKSVMDSVYDNNYGESFDDIADASQKVVQALGEMDPSALQETTESAITLRDTFGFDYQEQLRAVRQLMENFGVSSKDAYNLIAQGAQKGLDKNGDLLDTINEYSPYYSLAGRSAGEFFNSLKNGADEGTFSVDMLGDAYKEFTIKAKDTADTTTEAYQIMGLNADKMRSQFAAGGDSAKAATDVILESLFGIEDDVTRNQAGVDLFGTKWEDLGEKGVRALTDMNGEISETIDAMEGIKEVKYDSLTNKYEQLGRKFKTEVAVPIAEEFLPMAENGLDTLIENMDLMVPAIAGIGTAVGGLKLASVFGMAISPITLAVGALAGAAVAFATFADNAGEACEAVTDLAEANDRVVQSANDASEAAGETLSGYGEAMSDIEAKGEYAETLADRISDLAGTTGRSNAETEVMKQYISELNELVPDLSLSYDEQTDSLNRTSEEMKGYIKNSEDIEKARAAEKYRTELIQDQMDLEIEQIKLENQYSDLKKQRSQLTADMSDQEKDAFVSMSQWMTVFDEDMRDKKASYDDLSDSMAENSEASQENKDKQKEVEAGLEAVKKVIKKTTQAVDDSTGAIDESAAAAEEASARKQQAAEEEAQAYADATAQIVENSQSQIDMFGKATNLTGEELTSATEATLENMESQETAMENWAANLDALSKKGIDEGLLKYMAEMGPSGAEYVAQFASMTDGQLKNANETWKKTMESAGTGATLAAGFTGELEALKEKMKSGMDEAGSEGIGGLNNSLEKGRETIRKTSSNVADDGVKGTREGYNSQSPSKKMYAVGQDASVGLSNGILSKYASVRNGSKMVAESAVEEAKSALPSSTFYNFGQSVTEGLAQGILSGRSSVVNAVSSMCASAVSQAKRDLDINSPSKVFASLGEYSAEGYGEGFGKQMASVQGAIADSMRFAEPPRGQDTAGAYLDGNLENTIENALYNGMVYAMSRAKADKGDGSIQVSVNIGKRDITEVLVEADREHKARTGGIGLLEG